MAVGTTGAILGSAAIGGITSLLAGIIGSEAANSAATIQEKAALADLALQKEGLDYTKFVTERGRTDSLPWMEAGRGALDQYMVELGLPPLTSPKFSASAGQSPGGPPSTIASPSTGPVPTGTPNNPTGTTSPDGPVVTATGTGTSVNPDGGSDPEVISGTLPPESSTIPVVTPEGRPTPTAYLNSTSTPATGTVPTAATGGLPAGSKFRETPGYQFQVSEGEKGVTRNLAALGMKGSGAGLKALTRYRQGVADQTYDNYLTRLSNLATGGQQQTNTSNSLSLSGAGAVSAGLGGIGQAGNNAAAARASGYTGSANSWLGALNNFSNTAGNALGWLRPQYA